MRVVGWIAAGLLVAMMIACGGAGSPTAPVEDKAAVGRGFNRGENDLEGRSDPTPQEPIIEAAEKALKKYLKGKVQISGTPTVKILEAEKSWIVIGKYDSSVDKRHDFQSIIRLDSAGKYEAGNLMLDDDVVMDKILSKAAPKPKPEPTPIRTWTDAAGKHKTEAKYGGMVAGKVNLIKRDGSKVQLPLEKLSEEDQEWIKNRPK